MRGRVSLTLAALGLALGLTLTTGFGRPAAAQMASVDVNLGEYVFDPAELMVTAGDVAFNLNNVDSRRHDMAIDVNGTLLESPILGAGESGVWVVTLEPGTYDFWCSVGNHRERGMVGKLMVH